MSETSGIEPFYFKSYDMTIGIAHNVNELSYEIARLATENPGALEHHIKEGHIVEWLEHSNERELANELRGATSIDQFRGIIDRHLQKSKPVSESTPAAQKEPRKRAGAKKKSSKKA
ncbi:MAG: hypothetical protein JRN52_00885 [Nitrososphaerota archaeon]|nr:hypothetical protein [Nitrososphaerota archaeon]